MSDSVPHPRPQRLRWQILKQALWQLHPPVALVVRATQTQCLQTLQIASKPSANRLHLRNLFADGRRYYVDPQADGFRLTSDNRLLWGGRRSRSRMAAVVYGRFSSLDDEITFIRLHARMNILYLITGLLLPLFFSSIAISMPWSRPAVSVVVVLMFVLSLLGHRFNAALQVNEMVFFVQKALEDLPPVEVSRLPASGPDVIMSDFREQWYRFYREQTEKEESSR